MKLPIPILLLSAIALLMVHCELDPVEPEYVTAAFSVENDGCAAPCAVTFKNESQHALSYQWDFGDGTTATETNPSHTYDAAGSFSVQLVAVGVEGIADSLTKTVTIQETPMPFACFTITDISHGGYAPATVSFSNCSQYATQFKWDFGDGNVSDDENPGSHTYTTHGTYEVRLTVNDGADDTSMTVDVLTPILFDQTYGPGTATDLLELPGGGYVLAGYSSGDIHLVFTDEYGTVSSTRTIDLNSAQGDDRAHAMVQTASGGYAIAGHTVLAGDTNAFLIFTDEAGNLYANKTQIFGGVSADIAHSLVRMSNGKFALAGVSIKNGDADVYLVIADENGGAPSIKKFPSAEDEAVYAIIQATDGRLAMGGESGSQTTLFFTDANGNLVGDYVIGDQGSHALDIIQTINGGFGLAGVGISGIYPAPLLILTDAFGSKISQTMYGGRGEISSLVLRESGGFALAGWVKGIAPLQASFILTDPTGTYSSSTIYPTTITRANALINTADGGYAIAGYKESDFFLIKTDSEGNW